MINKPLADMYKQLTTAPKPKKVKKGKPSVDSLQSLRDLLYTSSVQKK